MSLGPLKTALQPVKKALRAVGHLAWWMGWRSGTGAGARPIGRGEGGRECEEGARA